MQSSPLRATSFRAATWRLTLSGAKIPRASIGRRRRLSVLSPNRHFSPEASDDGSNGSQPAAVPHPRQLDIPHMQLPKHVAIVMDGNVRWAQQKGLAAVWGHQAGVDALRSAVACCKQWQIPCLTVFAFSSENWQRDALEVSFLLSLMERVLRQELPGLVQQGVRMRFMGELGMLPQSLQAEIRRAELETGDNCDVHLTVALSYSSRQDICTAVQDIAHLVARGELHPSQVTPALIATRLSTRQLPEALQEPDLIIRTSGEQRLSNFLLWEAAYSELYFAPVFWPDFGEEQFAVALRDYAGRERRYGKR